MTRLPSKKLLEDRLKIYSWLLERNLERNKEKPGEYE